MDNRESPMNSNQRAIIFDMDGVLVDSEPVIAAAAIRGLAEFGVVAQPEDFVPFIGAGEIKFIGGVAEKYGVAYRPEMKDRVYQIYLQIVDEKLRLYADVPEWLQRLHGAGFALALASSADRIKVDANLRVAGIDPAIFRVLLSAEDVQHKKPHPEIYLTAALRLAMTPERCVVVEDAINGIRAAQAAGMRCYVVSTTFPVEALKKENPDFIAADFADVCREMIKLTN